MKQLHILLIGPYYFSNPWRWMADAWERLGHTTFRIGAEYREHGGITPQDFPRVDYRLQKQVPVWDLNAAIDVCYQESGKYPDLLIGSEETYHTEIIPQNKVPSALILFDLHPHSYRRFEDWQSTVAYTGQPFGIRGHTLPEPCPGYKYFAPAAAPWIHRYNNEKRIVDFALMATPYSFRPILCNGLRMQKFAVRDGIVDTEEYVKIYNSALTSFVNAGGQEEIKWRWSEHAAMGCINICDHTRLYKEIGARPWQHYVPVGRELQPEVNEEWPSVEMVAERIRFLKEEPDLAHLIREAARELVNERHTYYNRCEAILADLGFEEEADMIDHMRTMQWDELS